MYIDIYERGSALLKKTTLTVNTIIFIVALYFLNSTFDFPEKMAGQKVGPAFFPRVMLISLLVLLMIDTFSVLKKKDTEPLFDEEEKRKLLPLVAVILLIFVFTFLLGKINFILLASVILFSICMVLRLKWIPSVIVSVSLSVGVFLIFVEFFRVLL